MKYYDFGWDFVDSESFSKRQNLIVDEVKNSTLITQ